MTLDSKHKQRRALARWLMPAVAVGTTILGLGTASAIPMTPGWAAGTCYSGGPAGTLSGHVVGHMNTNEVTVTGGVNNPVTMYGPADWSRSRLGEVFGVTIDDAAQPNTFIAATGSYNAPGFSQWAASGVIGTTFGSWAQPGGIYRLDGITGAPANYAIVPNAGNGAKDTTGSLGNLCHDVQRHLIYVSNLDDGKIYRVSSTVASGSWPATATVVYDHGVTGRVAAGLTSIPDSNTNGLTQFGRRVYGVTTWNNRLYYGVWNNTTTSVGGLSEVWSVGLNAAGDAVTVGAGAPKKEITNATVFPITDITISRSGAMVYSERGLEPNSNRQYLSNPHSCSIYQYRLNVPGTAWIPGNTYTVGAGAGKNAAGGIDVDCDDTILSTGNYLATSPGVIYGMQIIPAATNPLGNSGSGTALSHLIDYDASLTNWPKNQIGDVALVKRDCPCVRIINQQASCDVSGNTIWTLNFENTTGFDISYIGVDGVTAGVTGPTQLKPIIPAIVNNTTATISFPFTVPTTVTAEVCFNLLLHNADLSKCCLVNFCFKPEPCLCVVGNDRLRIRPGINAYDYCVTFVNRTTVPVTRVVFANSPVGSTCPLFMSPIHSLTPPLLPGQSRTVCTPIIISPKCTNMKVIISLHDASYRSCCSVTRNLPSGVVKPPVLEELGPIGFINPRIDFGDMLADHYSAIQKVEMRVDGVVQRVLDGPPWMVLDPIAVSAGNHNVDYIFTNAYGSEVEGPALAINVPVGAAPQPLQLSNRFTMDAVVRDEDKALVLVWDYPGAQIETASDPAQQWQGLFGTQSPLIITDFADKKRFYRLRRDE